MWEISKLLINNPKRKKLGGERKERGMKKKKEGRGMRQIKLEGRTI